jgi:hypothetical protein
MQVTDAMIEAAMKKAVEAGWVQRNALLINHNHHNWEIMRGLLQAALNVMEDEKKRH